MSPRSSNTDHPQITQITQMIGNTHLSYICVVASLTNIPLDITVTASAQNLNTSRDDGASADH
jgi:hypothetical protein